MVLASRTSALIHMPGNPVPHAKREVGAGAANRAREVASTTQRVHQHLIICTLELRMFFLGVEVRTFFTPISPARYLPFIKSTSPRSAGTNNAGSWSSPRLESGQRAAAIGDLWERSGTRSAPKCPLLALKWVAGKSVLNSCSCCVARGCARVFAWRGVSSLFSCCFRHSSTASFYVHITRTCQCPVFP